MCLQETFDPFEHAQVVVDDKDHSWCWQSSHLELRPAEFGIAR
jgi:hypothetical protein